MRGRLFHHLSPLANNAHGELMTGIDVRKVWSLGDRGWLVNHRVASIIGTMQQTDFRLASSLVDFTALRT
jgi:hypothetical protein